MEGLGAKLAHIEDYPLLFEQHPQALWIFDLDTLRLLAVNTAAAHAYRYPKAEMLELTLLELAPEEHRPILRRCFEKVAHNLVEGESRARSFQQRRKDGTLFEVELTWGRVDLGGQPVGMAMAVDISGSSRGERMVLAQNGLLEMIARGEPLGRILDALVLFAERELPGLLGSVLLLDDEGKHVFHGSAPSLPKAYTDVINGLAIGPRAGSCGTAAYYGVAVIVHDIRTDPRWDGYREYALPHGLVSCWSTPITSAGGKVLGTFALYYREPRSPTADELGFIDVVTAVARIAIERDHAARVLGETNRALRAIVDSSPNAVVGLDRDARVRTWNPSAERIFGYRADEVLGQPLAILPEGGRPAELHPGTSMPPVELDLERKDGTRAHVRASVVGTFDAAGGLERISWFLQDRSENQALEEQLRQAQKMEAVGLLAGGIAHDFNNLLTVINSYSDLLLGRLGSGGPLTEMVSEIRAAGDRASQLTRQLLAFGRKQVLTPVRLDLNDLLSGVASMLRRLIGEDIALHCVLDAHAPTIFADRGQIEQVAINLALNARDAMPHGGRIIIATRDLEIDAARAAQLPGVTPGPHVAMIVSDTGHGMDEATMRRVFEPFFTTKGPGKGTGLGLAMVYGTVRQSGGFVEVESTPGKGSIFTVVLPRELGHIARPDTAPRHHSAAARAVETVLLVEDEGSIRQLCRQVLVEQGYQVLDAGSGPDALARAAAHEGDIDILVTDVVMPHMSGRTLADRIRESRPGIKVLYVSGYTDDAIVRHGVSEDAVAFLAKPFSPATLLARVREVLDRDAA